MVALNSNNEIFSSQTVRSVLMIPVRITDTSGVSEEIIIKTSQGSRYLDIPLDSLVGDV